MTLDTAFGMAGLLTCHEFKDLISLLQARLWSRIASSAMGLASQFK